MVEVPGAEAILAGKQAIGPALSNYKSQITAICAALAEDRDRVQVCTATGNRSKTYSEVKQKLVGYALGRQAYLEKRARFHPAPLLHQRYRIAFGRGVCMCARVIDSRALACAPALVLHQLLAWHNLANSMLNWTYSCIGSSKSASAAIAYC